MSRVIASIAIVLASSTAFADEASARKKFEAGERAYNLGKFGDAVELFKEAYEEWPEPAFLFNIAQTYRQMGDCKQAQFFYKRFLALKANDAKKPLKPQLQAEVEKRITELEECVRRELASKPPQQLESGSSGTTTGTSTGSTGSTTTGSTGSTTGSTPANATTGTTTGQVEQTDQPDEADIGEAPEVPTSGQPKLLSVRANVGGAKVGAGDLEVPIQFGAAIVGGYPLSINDKMHVELGAAFSFTPLPYTTSTNEKGSGALLGIMANAAPTYALIPKLAARVDIGAGVMLFSGLQKMGNPFTMSGAAATGALTTFHVRAGLSGDYAVTNSLVVTATPIAFGYSPAPSGFQDSISALTTISFYVGVGYRQ